MGPDFRWNANNSDTNFSIVFGKIFNTNATSNVTYGGGVFFNTKKAAKYPVPVPAVVGMGLFIASGFFARRAEEARTKRIVEAKQEYFLMP